MTPIECSEHPVSRRTGKSVPKKALITGNRGQHGSHLANLLPERGCEVHALIGEESTFNAGRIEHLDADPRQREVRLCTESVRPLRRRTAGYPTEQHRCP